MALLPLFKKQAPYFLPAISPQFGRLDTQDARRIVMEVPHLCQTVLLVRAKAWDGIGLGVGLKM